MDIEQHPGISRLNGGRLARLILAGGLAGLLASAPMGVAMIGMNRLLPRLKRRPLPPKQITRKIALRSGAGQAVPRGQQWDALTWLAHLGYGAAVAAPYPLITRRLPLPRMISGMLFALLVWAGSYLGWLPALRILPSAAEMPARRNAIMIASHLLWGALIGVLAGRLDKTDARSSEIPLNDWSYQ